jgi:ribosome-binding protein aMBF1 (putative translation factor)
MLILSILHAADNLLHYLFTGKAIPNPQILAKMSRILGVTLKKST